ncbi:DNA cytosine methyltransferase [Xanthomonas sp. PPL139]|uniref:DNA cytosine methyltransferase n=1 Tax=unclassified Xanthomonas TaxID=2643310 RepID=UPI00339F5288
MSKSHIYAVDLFCGVGGLSYGLKKSGIQVVAGYDLDATCQSTYESNVGAKFIAADIRALKGKDIAAHYPAGSIRLLAGCAPCQPFSRHMRGVDTSNDEKWGLLDEFLRIVRSVKPELVTMENVAPLQSTDVFKRFVDGLRQAKYSVQYRSCYAPRFGLAQHRRRLVVIASRLGNLTPLPDAIPKDAPLPTVKDVIGALPKISSGEQCSVDPLHRARALTEINLRRIRASKPGGTWRDWPESLRAPCHKRESGSSFQSVYARMCWDKPSPTITTQAYNFGTGRFGHPEQDRAITLREAAMLQGFPENYQFVRPGAPVEFISIGKHIGNAVPPPLGEAVGKHFLNHIEN